MDRRNILIVGAGITGTALYGALTKQGVRPKIIEKTQNSDTKGVGICLPGNAMVELKKLGLDQHIMAAAHRVYKIEYADQSGRCLGRASLTDEPYNQAPFVSLPRSKLLAVLKANCEDQIHFNTTVQSIQNSDAGVAVTFSDGIQEAFDLVIGADGINSQIRRSFFADTKMIKPGITNWRFTINADMTNKHPVYYIGHHSAFMIYPMGKQTAYCYAQTGDPNQVWVTEESVKALHTLFDGFCQPVGDAIARICDSSDVIIGQLKSVDRVAAVNQRVVILGDALHGCPPTLQQGVGMGLEDVNCLVKLLKSHNISETLNQFEVIRAPRVNWVVNESNNIIKLAAMGQYWLGRRLRNLKIRKYGPTNVLGWRKLMSEKPY